MMADFYNKYENMSIEELLSEFDTEKWSWICKRLSGNDTGLSGGHQSGIYIPRWFAKEAFHEICITNEYNPSINLSQVFYIDQGIIERAKPRAIYYNNKFYPQRKKKEI